MMREIKFRAKPKNTELFGEWVYGWPFFENRQNCPVEEGVWWFLYPGLTGSMQQISVDATTIGEYTGLKDKNGREIYEGDIVRFDLQDYQGGDHISILPVVYRGSSFGFAMRSEPSIPEPDCWEDLDIVEAEDMEYEVLGNIHENPELLK
jgi:uncharacterized phage protein (TIGR01671 family)